MYSLITCCRHGLKKQINSLSKEKRKIVPCTFRCSSTKQNSNDQLEIDEDIIQHAADNPHFRSNPLHIQMLSKGLYNQIFSNIGNKSNEITEEEQENIDRSIHHLKSQGLWGKESSIAKDINFILPELQGNDLLNHLSNIGNEQADPYMNLINSFLKSGLPPLPLEWEYAPGWTRYNPDKSISSVEYPPCDALVFDVEVCVVDGQQPTMATAVSKDYWYSWCSLRLIDVNYQFNGTQFKDLIPMEDLKTNPSHPRIIAGHNVSYDRLKIRDQYHINNSKMRFIDTMSLNIAVCGLVFGQRLISMANRNLTNKIWSPWMKVGCQNSLKEAYKFHCQGELQKEDRNIFVKGSLDDIRQNFQTLMKYCASDVVATYKLLGRLYPEFCNRFPHPITFAGMLEMGSTFLPVNNNWNTYISSSEKQFEIFQGKLSIILVKYAKEALAYKENEKYRDDVWLWDLDWDLPKSKVKILPHFPNWYRKLYRTNKFQADTTIDPQKLTTSLKIIPKLLRLTWEGYPLHFEIKYGWGYLMAVDLIAVSESNIDEENPERKIFPLNSLKNICAKVTGKTIEPANILSDDDNNIDWDNFFNDSFANKKSKKSQPSDGIDIGIPGVLFFQLPHKNGPLNKVGNPLSKDFLRKFEDKVLRSEIPEVAELVLNTTKTLSYWRNNRDRLMSQVVVWSDDLSEQITKSDRYDENSRYGVILPQVVTAGTVTRRAVEKTWMTASNAYVDRIGSELKSIVQAPPGYHFVGADVDSQELWIAAVLGDSYFAGFHGATALGWMTLQGKKAEGTDMHSRTAQQASISRDQAKIMNYGRIYGAGLKFVQQLLRQFNPNLTEPQCFARATDLIVKTKGEKCYYLNKAGEDTANLIDFPYDGQPLSRKQVYSLVRKARHHFSYTFHDVVEQPSVWMGGSESYTFNCLEAVIRFKEPRTPVLGARISKSLEPASVEDEYMTSRMNWVVQSSAVDYLHLLLVSMKWLCDKYKIDARFCMSIHDEVRYMVPSEDRYRAALALQIANLHTRAIFAIRLGMNDLPLSVSFFSGVDIDTVLRKEPHLECVTPSNPEGLLKGYGIPPGESVDIYQILEITKGVL